MSDDVITWLIAQRDALYARAERLQAQRDRLLAAVTDGAFCRLCDGFGAESDEQIEHREDCATRCVEDGDR